MTLQSKMIEKTSRKRESNQIISEYPSIQENIMEYNENGIGRARAHLRHAAENLVLMKTVRLYKKTEGTECLYMNDANMEC